MCLLCSLLIYIIKILKIHYITKTKEVEWKDCFYIHYFYYISRQNISICIVKTMYLKGMSYIYNGESDFF